MLITGNFIPNVTKAHLEVSHEPGVSYWGSFYSFGLSNRLMFHTEHCLFILFNNGAQWRIVDTIGADAYSVMLDQFHTERAFVTCISGGFAVTEDAGKSWRHIPLPEKMSDGRQCSIETHPSRKNLLLLHCTVLHGDFKLGFYSNKRTDTPSFMEVIAYASDDGGASFKRLATPVDECNATSDLEFCGVKCRFMNFSEEPIANSDDIFCNLEITRLTDTHGWSTFPYAIDIGRKTFKKMNPSEPVLSTMNIPFYVADCGRNLKVFDEFQQLIVEKIWNLSSGALVLTSDGVGIENTSKSLWIWTSGSFKPVQLPKDVSFSPNRIQDLLEVDPKRILIYADVQGDGEDRNSECVLISDTSFLKFSFFNITLPPPAQKMRLYKMENLRGTLWGEFTFQEVVNEGYVGDSDRSYFDEKASWFNQFMKILHLIILKKPSPRRKDARRYVEYRNYEMTKLSFDNGKSWSNLRVADPSGMHRHLFKCNIEDVDHCSLHGSGSLYSSSRNEPTAGVLIRTGNVGRYASALDHEDDMTFISRDGGRSWEILFEYRVDTAFLDFGNIIVAIPSGDDCLRTKFLFSLDQGISWEEYKFDEPICVRDMRLHSWGLNLLIGLGSSEEGLTEYIFYSVSFSEAYEGRACDNNDWQNWYLAGGKCIDNFKSSFKRKKLDARCLMRNTFKDLLLDKESCFFENFTEKSWDLLYSAFYWFFDFFGARSYSWES